jgi:hypothetical protein
MYGPGKPLPTAAKPDGASVKRFTNAPGAAGALVKGLTNTFCAAGVNVNPLTFAPSAAGDSAHRFTNAPADPGANGQRFAYETGSLESRASASRSPFLPLETGVAASRTLLAAWELKGSG